MDRLERETAAVLLEAAAINYARWHMAYCAQFHNLPGDKLDEAIRAGDEARRQLCEAAHRYVGEPPMLAELVKALGWSGGTVHAAIAQVRQIVGERNAFRAQLGAERERAARLLALLDDTRRANDSLRAQLGGAAPTVPGLERP